MDLTRRSLLRGAGGLLGVHLAGWPAVGAAPSGLGEPRFVLVQLRGGLDGLAAVPALGDPHFVSARAGLADTEAGEPLRLDDFFGLHPALPTAHALYAKREMLVVHAVATPYRERSHFDGQNLLESGGTRAFHLEQGWLGRAMDAAAGSARSQRSEASGGGLALGPALPLVLRGERPAASWSPTSLPAPDPRLVAAVERLYAGDPTLGPALEQAQRAQDVIGRPEVRRGRGAFPTMARAAATFLADPDGPRVAVLDLDGFDSHSLQALPFGGLQRSLGMLDQGLLALREGLGSLWGQTVVLVHTEFGRTVAMNGSAGSDHGTAGVALLLGGAVKGGRVLGDWPGLRKVDLYEGRDLRPTTDLRAVWKGVLRDHLRLSEGALGTTVLPASSGVAPLAGLLRT